MNPLRLTAIVLIAAACGAAPAAFAEPQPQPQPQPQSDPQSAPPPGERLDGPGGGMARGPDAGPGPGERRGPGGFPPRHGPGLAFLRGLELSEAQQDRLFAILHAEAPQLREQDKQERKAREALRAMFDTGEFDEPRAALHTKALGQAVAARELLRVRTAGRVMALLTPEQRARIGQDRDGRTPRR